MRVYWFFLLCCFHLTAESSFLTDREEQLIQHVKKSLEFGERKQSKLTEEVLQIQGMSSPKVRHFLNHLGSLSDAHYLEVGCWKGSTWIAALFGNEKVVRSAVAIDNWSEFEGPKESFERNCAQFIQPFNYKVFSVDCFKLNLSVFDAPIDIYFYDGNHQASSQEKAFTYFNEIFNDSFIAVVDDWNWADVQKGTKRAFRKLGYQVLFEQALPAGNKGSDKEQWWNGLYVAVVRKKSDP